MGAFLVSTPELSHAGREVGRTAGLRRSYKMEPV